MPLWPDRQINIQNIYEKDDHTCENLRTKNQTSIVNSRRENQVF